MALRIFGGLFKGRILKSPSEKITRPTQGIVRQAVFNICQEFIQGARFLDLFAGSGAMGLEALSRGAAEIVFVEKNKAAIECIQENLNKLQITRGVKILAFDAVRALDKLTEPFDIIYVDPPYGTALQTLVETIQEKNLLKGYLFLEEHEKEHSPIQIPGLELYASRRYGVALLSIYKK